MRVILEGPDNAGKTTLANKLRELGVEYFHPGGPPKDYSAEVDCMTQQRAKLGVLSNIVMDRVTCISQQVYNHHVGYNEARNLYLNELLAVHPILIYCRPSTDRLMRKQDFTWRDGETEEHKQKIIEGQHLFIGRYDDLMQRTPHIVYNFEDSSAEMVLDALRTAFGGTSDAESAHGYLQQLMHHRRNFG
jgi:adenylate kinase family enzyme